MFVIDRNNGHCCCNVGRSVLLEGKSYMVIIWFYHSPMVTWKIILKKEIYPNLRSSLFVLLTKMELNMIIGMITFFFDRRNETIKNRTI